MRHILWYRYFLYQTAQNARRLSISCSQCFGRAMATNNGRPRDGGQKSAMNRPRREPWPKNAAPPWLARFCALTRTAPSTLGDTCPMPDRTLSRACASRKLRPHLRGRRQRTARRRPWPSAEVPSGPLVHRAGGERLRPLQEGPFDRPHAVGRPLHQPGLRTGSARTASGKASRPTSTCSSKGRVG